jgi:LuxR family maltose regulon positive regulatory protein
MLIIMEHLEDIESILQDAEMALATKAYTQDLDESEVQSMRGEVAAMRAMILAANEGEVQRAIEIGRQALDQLPEDSFLVRSVITMNLGNAYHMNDNLEQASQTLTEAVSLSQKVKGNIIIAMFSAHNLAIIEEEKGQLRQAAAYHRQVLQFSTKRDKQGKETTLPIAGLGHIGLAEILREWNDLEKAKEHLTTGIQLGERGQQFSIVQIGSIILARILQAQGDEAGALEAIEKAKALSQKVSEQRLWVDAVQARLWLAQGNLAAATQWEQKGELPLGGDFNCIALPGEYSTLARLYITQERFEEATNLLQRMLTAAEAAGRWGRVLEIVMLQALARYAQGNPQRALAPLTRALSLAEPENYTRLFVDEGPAMAQLLHLAKSRGIPHRGYIDKLLSTFETSVLAHSKEQLTSASLSLHSVKLRGVSRLIEPLSQREREVLGLIANGLSNREIAEQLFITVGTAKTHANNIYRKLDVRSRTQAVARATELGLL